MLQYYTNIKHEREFELSIFCYADIITFLLVWTAGCAFLHVCLNLFTFDLHIYMYNNNNIIIDDILSFWYQILHKRFRNYTIVHYPDHHWFIYKIIGNQCWWSHMFDIIACISTEMSMLVALMVQSQVF